MIFKTLQNICIADITVVFNHAFSDYIVPIQLTQEQMVNKIKGDGINLQLSVGAFDDDRLVAFIFHGYDEEAGKQIFYNAGTGVIPSHRGNGITKKMYAFILQKLNAKQGDKTLLEVITENKPAIKTYTGIGFQAVRTLNCYKGTLALKPLSSNHNIKIDSHYDWDTMASFWDVVPSWQNSVRALKQLQQTNVLIAAYDSDCLVGYIIYNPLVKRAQQFGVAKSHRKKGIGSQLFAFVAQHYSPEISVINIDDNDKNCVHFLESSGLNKFVTQYEMEMAL